MKNNKIKLNKREFLNKTKIDFYQEIKKYQKELKPTNQIEGYPSGVIVGEKSYPNLKTYSISNFFIQNSFFNTSQIVKKDYTQIIKLKAKNILGSTRNLYIKDSNSRLNKELQDIYKSKKPIQFSSKFENELKFDKVLISKVSGIVGSKNELLKIFPNENTKTSKQIEKFTQNDIKSENAVISLYNRKINEHQIINLFSLGSFGIDINKKLVPTKWAISAYDQIIEKYLYKKIINYKLIENFEIFYHNDKGNSFLIIQIPNEFSCEIIEKFDNNIERDYVRFDNKLKKDEPETAGGFFATKLAIFEQLEKRKRQASFISIRIIEGYDIPLGVVFVRESVRQAMKNRIFESSNILQLEQYLKLKFDKHYNYYKISKVLEEFEKQKKLRQFI